MSNGSKGTTLVSLCRGAIIASLERFPPESLVVLDTFEWENIISLRHDKTKPKMGRGGLDGTGRMTPAISEQFITEVEETCPHLAGSDIADKKVWKDLVEYKFKAGGLARPTELMYPYPALEAEIERSKRALLDYIRDHFNNGDRCVQAISFLHKAPMDISLLSSSGIGKTASKFIKKAGAGGIVDKGPGETPRDLLQKTISSWMALAANSGVKLKDSSSSSKNPRTSRNSKNLDEARRCQTWKKLFMHLKVKGQEQRSNLAQRMSEKRKKLDKIRPKIVKVSHASSRQRSILDGSGGGKSGWSVGSSSSSKDSKMTTLRQEAKVTSARRAINPVNAAATANRPATAVAAKSAGFGAAVAFAQTSRKRKSSGGHSNRVQHIEIAGNRRMKVPATKKASENIKRLKMLKKPPKKPKR